MFNFFKKEKELIIEKEIKPVEDFNDVTPISKYFHNETGVTFDKQTSILKSKVSAFCKRREIYSFETLLEKVKSDAQIKQDLINHLTTNETYFYRELKQIVDLMHLVKSESANVTILCAPSSTGEEPYSIAIALLEAGVLPSKFKILGIDINSDAIEKSEEAIYGDRNLRNLSSEIITKYFIKKNDSYILNEHIKSLVSFKVVNILDDSLNHIGKFDFIFSRNMLIYFDKETKLRARKILENLRKNDTHDVFFGHADLF